MNDYAVVVGVGRYPGLSADLDGPDNDAKDVYDWLISEKGGNVDPAHIKLLRSGDFEPPDPDHPQPAVAGIEEALKWVEKQTRETNGDRLYLYFSGHGFSPLLEEAAIFTAEATQVSPTNVYAYAWLRWFRNAQRFREVVLWMDCCMDFQQTVPVQEVIMRSELGTSVPGPVFIGLAAHTRRALELKMADGKVHGVFTWTLMKGLAGGAADERGQVTGESLRTFLYAVMPEYLPDDVRRAGEIDLQPFVRADQDLVYRTLHDRPKCRVHLSVPDSAAGQQLKIWTGRPPRRVHSKRLDGTQWDGSLVRGLYVAEVPSAKLRHGFQITGSNDVEVSLERSGEPVKPSDGSKLFTLDVDAANPAASIAVMDYQFNRIASGTGKLRLRDMAGVYKVRIEIGRNVSTIADEVVLIDRDTTVMTSPSQLASPAPIPGSSFAPASHTPSFTEMSARLAPSVAGTRGVGATREPAAVSVMTRYWMGAEPGGAGQRELPHPMQGLRLVRRAGTAVADLIEDCALDDTAASDPLAIWESELKPGAYFLRQTLPGRRVCESCIVTSPGWVTQVAIRRRAPGDAGAAASVQAIGDAAVFMRRPGGMPDPEQDATLEAARMALAQGRDLFADGRGVDLQSLLLEKYDDPVAGIIGGHLLLRSLASRPDQGLTRKLEQVVVNLRGMVGHDHPDVEALSLKCADKSLRRDQPFTDPPMLSHSWQLIAEASYAQPELAPIQLWQRVHAAVGTGPMFVWAADKKTKAAHAGQLNEWIGSYDGGGARRRVSGASRVLPKAAREDGLRMQMPAVAASALWMQREG